MGFKGSVESFSLADIFQNLAMNQQTGTLRVFVRDTEMERNIFFDAGQVKYLSHGKQKPLLLGEILVGRGVVKEDQVAEALQRQTENKEPLGANLVQLGYMEQGQVDELVTHQIEEEIYDIFGWEAAQFEFIEGPPPKDLFIDQLTGKGSNLPISHLIMEAARRVDEWERLRQQVPSFREIYVAEPTVLEAVQGGKMEIDVIEQRVLMMIDGSRDVDDLIRDTYLFRFEVLQALAAFLQSSMIRPASAEELQAAATRLEQEGERPRRCKVLERLLAVKGDDPEMRLALAEALSAEAQNEKAAIHFSVLAEADIQAGNEEKAVALYKRILQILPQHLHSRERLGAIYARRGQGRDAVYQYQELIAAYKANQQYAEARSACVRALECEPSNIEVRQELIQVYIAEDNKAAAAREYENLGDILAKQAQVKPAADSYRKAMQLVPSQGHLKEKLAGVMLTSEDRRAQRKRNLMITVGAAAVVVICLLIGLHEFAGWQLYNAARQEASVMIKEAEELEHANDLNGAKDRLQEAASVWRRDGLQARSSPFLRIGPTVKARMDDVDRRISNIDDKIRARAEEGKNDSLEKLNSGLAALRAGNFYKAQADLKYVIDNKFSQESHREEAVKSILEAEEAIKRYEGGIARIKAAVWRTVDEEFNFKVGFRSDFKDLPEFKKWMENDENYKAVKLPLKIICATDAVRVALDDTFINSVGPTGDNIFHYDPDKNRKFDFSKPGYKTVTRSIAGLRETFTVRLVREPIAQDREARIVGPAVSGQALLDGATLLIGADNGDLYRFGIDEKGKVKQVGPPLHFLQGAGINSRVYGGIFSFEIDGKKTYLFTTQSGDCLASNEPDTNLRLVVLGQRLGIRLLQAPANVTRIPRAGNKIYYLLPVGRKVLAIGTEKDAQLKLEGEVPGNITTTPVLMPNGTEILLGCDDGNLYTLDILQDGKKTDRVYTGRTPNVPIIGQPLIYRDQVIAFAKDPRGSAYFFELKGGAVIQAPALGGLVQTPAVMRRDTLWVGTGTTGSVSGIDMAGQAIGTALKDENDAETGFVGSVCGGIAFMEFTKDITYLYFGTEEGMLYAFEMQAGKTKMRKAWEYHASTRIAGAPIVKDAQQEKQVIFILENGEILVFQE